MHQQTRNAHTHVLPRAVTADACVYVVHGFSFSLRVHIYIPMRTYVRSKNATRIRSPRANVLGN